MSTDANDLTVRQAHDAIHEAVRRHNEDGGQAKVKYLGVAEVLYHDYIMCAEIIVVRPVPLDHINLTLIPVPWTTSSSQ